MSSNKHPKFTWELLPEGTVIQYNIIRTGERGARVVTVAYLYKANQNEGDPLASGVAIRDPRDEYNEDLGKRMALGRAVRQWWERKTAFGDTLTQAMAAGLEAPQPNPAV